MVANTGNTTLFHLFQMNRFVLPPSLQEITIGPHILKGYYVYEWRCRNIPFYIGMGTNRRAWNIHLSPPESRRRASSCFRVVIIRHNLSKKQAHLAERYHTKKRLAEGFQLLNDRIPTGLINVSSNEKRNGRHSHPSQRSNPNDQKRSRRSS